MKPSFGKILVGVVAFGLCLGAAFGAGTVYGRHSKTPNAAAAGNTTFNRGTTGNTDRTASSTATSAAVAASGTPQTGNTTGGGSGFFGGFGARPLEGSVASVSATELQVTLGTGGASTNPTSIAINDQTTYAMAKPADKSALTSGAHVYVTTSAASDGTLDADSIIVLPASKQTTTQSTGGQSTTGPSGTGRGTGGFGGNGGQGIGGFGNGGGGFGGPNANRPVDGTVNSANGQQLEVTLVNGSTTTVNLVDKTTYATTVTADQSAVTTGSTVLITVSRGSTGFTAESVVVLPASGATN